MFDIGKIISNTAVSAAKALTHQPMPVKRQGIPKSGGGVRELGIPTALDRFVQQAILQVLQPRFYPTFSEHSHGFRPGRRAHDAVWRRSGTSRKFPRGGGRGSRGVLRPREPRRADGEAVGEDRGQAVRSPGLARWDAGSSDRWPHCSQDLRLRLPSRTRWVRRLPLLTRCRSAAGYALLVLPAYWVSGAFAIWATQRHVSLAWSLAAGSIVVAFALGSAPWVGRAIGFVRRAPPRAIEAFSLAQQRVGGPPARLLVLPIASANALAFQLTRTIGVTQGALDHLDDAELGAILAHELGHLREPPGVVLLRTAVATFVPVSLVILPWVVGLRSEWSWLALWLFVIAVVLLYRRLQRALERRADAVGLAVSPIYAAALEKVYQTNLAPAVLRRTATHPALFDRMLAAGATPAWPRPRPPPSLLPALVVLVALAGATFAGAWRVRSLVERGGGDGWSDLALFVAMEGRPSDAGRLGYWHLKQHNESAALALFRAAEAMGDSDATWPALVATVLSYQGHCDEAGEASMRATSRDPSSPHARAAHGLVEACAESHK